MDDIDEVMKDLDARNAERAAKEREESMRRDGMREEGQPERGRTLVGRVDHFYDKIGVAGANLTGRLKLGDTIEIENEEYAIRQRVSSMQIDGNNVQEASDGDSVGIKLFVPAPSRGSIYRLD
jgi:translation initiation factor IF-2